ncbi:MAG: SDR family oxidoreductase [Microscillaceae bacterium]|nr:SDR family oxidoreductase [Microscillaceae bacterium]
MPSIFITGAASGIGKATALLFAQKGWFVGLSDVNEAALSDLHTRLGPDKCFARVMDVRQAEQVQSVLEQFGQHTQQGLDLLFNNAGILYMGPFETISLDKQKRMVEVNLMGILNCTYQALPLLKNQPGAQIINMSSASAMYGIPEFAVYSATKHAVRALTEALSLEFESYKIKVSDIMPSFVRTPMVEAADYKAGSLRKTKQMLSAEKIAETVWKASQTHKVHWKLPKALALAETVLRLVPNGMRNFVRKSTLKE